MRQACRPSVQLYPLQESALVSCLCARVSGPSAVVRARPQREVSIGCGANAYVTGKGICTAQRPPPPHAQRPQRQYAWNPESFVPLVHCHPARASSRAGSRARFVFDCFGRLDHCSVFPPLSSSVHSRACHPRTASTVYVCKYATLQDCQDQMAAPLDPSIPTCALLQLNTCQFVLQLGLYTIIKPIGSDYVADVFTESSCTKPIQSRAVSGSKCTSVYEVRFSVCDLPTVIKNRMLHLLA